MLPAAVKTFVAGMQLDGATRVVACTCCVACLVDFGCLARDAFGMMHDLGERLAEYEFALNARTPARENASS
jgi:hypothetical protein